MKFYLILLLTLDRIVVVVDVVAVDVVSSPFTFGVVKALSPRREKYKAAMKSKVVKDINKFCCCCSTIKSC